MDSADLQRFIGTWLPNIESEMHLALASDEEALAAHYGMLRYHLGWANESLEDERSPSGKRLRPMFCLLASTEVGGDTASALPAAAAIELIHNFSLIHDDVEDGDTTRRHRPTVWSLWGVPQAINAGDAMFAIAYRAIQGLERRDVPAERVLAAIGIFTETCIQLTEGQHLDMSFEDRDDVSVAEYMRMIDGKTAALLGASLAIGAIIGGADAAQRESLWRFGRAMGLAFQIQDDILGLWGDPAVTGKAAGNDFLRRKKSLPLLYTLDHATAGSAFRALMAQPADEAQLPEAMELLSQACARAHAEQQLLAYHQSGIDALQDALGHPASSSMLRHLADSLLNRTS